jgi:hypothetical protein
MGRGGKAHAAHPGGHVNERQSIRRRKDEPWDPMNTEDDPLHDLRAPAEDLADHSNDEYVWPEFNDEDED